MKKDNENDGLMEIIKRYSLWLDALELSPFELHFAFLLRSDLEEEKDQMTKEDKEELYRLDQFLYEHKEEYRKHLSKIHDFKNCSAPLSEWWWHLDKRSDGNRKKNVRSGKLFG